MPAAPSSQVVHQPTFSPSLSSSFARPLPFPLTFRPRPCEPYLDFDLVLVAARNLDDDPCGFELEYDSAGSAKDIRLGVDVPDELLDRPKKSGTLSKEGEGDGLTAVTGVEGCERFFIDDCLGGDGARVEVVCRGFVNNLDTDAVALEVPEVGATVGGDKRDGLDTGGAEQVEEERGLPDA